MNPTNPVTPSVSFADYIKTYDVNKQIVDDPVKIKAGYSQYDAGFILPKVNPEAALNEHRAYAQPWEDKLGNGLANMTMSAFTGALESSLGLAYGAGAALVSGDASSFYNNEFGRTMDSMNEAVRESNPFYYSKAEQEASLLSSLGTSNFWFDKVLGGAGYTIGSLVTGYGAAKLFQMGKNARLAQLATDANAAEAAGGLIPEAAKFARWDMAKQMALGGVMAHGESSMEARQTYDVTKERYEGLREQALANPDDVNLDAYRNLTDEKIEELSASAADTNYLTNMAITGPTDMILLGKFINPGKKAAVRTYNEIGKRTAVGGATEYFDKVVTQKARSLMNAGSSFLKGFTTEGAQEGLQYSSNIAAQEFVEAHGIQGQEWFGSLLSGMAQGLGETLSSKEGLESILVGGIVGGPFGLKGARAERVAQDARTKNLVDSLNADPLFLQSNPSVRDFLSATNNANKSEDYLKQGDVFNAKNSADQALNTYIKSQINNGTTDYFIERLNSLKEMDQSEMDKYFGPGTTPQQIDQIIEKVGKLSELNNSIETLYGTPGGTEEQKQQNAQLRERLFFSAATIKDVEGRMTNITKELAGMGNPEVNAVLAARSNAIGLYKMVTPETAPKDRIFEEYRNEMQKQAVDNYNAIVEQFEKDNPVEASQAMQLLADLNQLDERKQDFIKYYNQLNDPEKARALLEKDARILEENGRRAALLAEEEEKAKTQGRTTIEDIDTLLPLNKDRKNEIQYKGQTMNLAKMSAEQFADFKRALEDDFQSTGEDISSEMRAAINKEDETRSNTTQVRLQLKEALAKATTPEEVDQIVADMKADTTFNVNQDQINKLKKSLADAIEAKRKQVEAVETVKNNFKGENEFYHAFAANPSEKENLEKAAALPDMAKRTYFRIVRNPNPVISDIGNAAKNTLNPRLKKQSPPIIIEVWAEMGTEPSVKVGSMPWYGQYVNTSGNPIDIQNLTFDQYVMLFLPGMDKVSAEAFVAENPDKYNLDSFKRAQRAMMSLFMGAEQALGSNQEVILNPGETRSLANVSLSQGEYVFSEEPLENFRQESTVNKPFEINGTPVIISTSTFDGSVVFQPGKEIVPDNYVPGVLDLDGAPVTLDPSTGQIRAELLPALNALSQRLKSPKVGEVIYNKYWMLVEDEQGTVKIPGSSKSYDWRPVSARQYTVEESDNLLKQLKELAEKRKDIKDAQELTRNLTAFRAVAKQLFIAIPSKDAIKSFKQITTEITVDKNNKLTLRIDILTNPATPEKGEEGEKVYNGKVFMTIPDNVVTTQDFITWFNKELQKEQQLTYRTDSVTKTNKKAPFSFNGRLAPINPRSMRVNFATVEGAKTKSGINKINPSNVWQSFSSNVSRMKPRENQKVVVRPVVTAASQAMNNIAQTAQQPVTVTSLPPGLTSGTQTAAPASLMTVEQLNQVWNDIRNGVPVDPFFEDFAALPPGNRMFPEDLVNWFEKKTNTKVGRQVATASTAPVSTDAKADIKRRRKEATKKENIRLVIGSVPALTKNANGNDAAYSIFSYDENGNHKFPELVNIYGATPQELIDKINAKYDELAAQGATPVATNVKADIEKELLGSFANTTERVVNSKGPNNGRTVRTELTSTISSDGEVIVFKSKNTFTDNGDSLTSSSASMTIEEFKEHFYPMLTADEIEMFEETLEVYKKDGWNGMIFFKELRVGSSKATNLKGRVNLNIMIGVDGDYVFTLTKKLTNAELAALEAAPAATTKYKREDFPDTQTNTRTPVTQRLLDYFAEVLGIPKFTEDLSKGTYISWLQNANPIGYAVADALNAPKQAFDIIAAYEAELTAQGAAPAQERPSRSRKAGGAGYAGANSIGTYDEGEVIDRETAVSNIQALLPDFIKISELEQTVKNLRNGMFTFGSFYNNVIKLASKVVKGREFHEAFHALFRTMLTDTQIDALYKEAKNLMISQFKKEGKSFVQAYGEWKLERVDYENLPENIKKDLFIEEWMADEYPKWREGKSVVPKKATTFLGKLFDLLKRVANWFTGTPSLGEFFQAIDEGKFSGDRAQVTNRFTNPMVNTEARSQIYVGNREGVDGNTYASFLDPALQMVLTNTIVSNVLSKRGTGMSDVDIISMEMLELADKFDANSERFNAIADNPAMNDVFEKVLDLDFLFRNDDVVEVQTEKGTEQRNFGEEARAMFIDNVLKQLNEFQAEDTGEVNDNPTSADENMDGDAEVTERNFDLNFENKGGFTSLSKFLRKYISTTVYNTSLDEFFGLEPGSVFGDERITVAVNPKKVYNGLTKITANKGSASAVLRSMMYMAQEPSESGRFVAKFFEDSGITFENGELKYDPQHEALIQTVVKGFSNYSVDYLFTQFDRSFGEGSKPFARIFASNRRNMDTQQLGAWTAQFNVLTKRNGKQEMQRRAEVIRGLNALALTGKITDELVERLSSELKQDLQGLGISLSKTYIKFLLLQNRVTKTLAQDAFVAEFQKSVKMNASEVHESLVRIKTLIAEGANPFVKQNVEGEDKSAITKLRKLAMDNAVFDENVNIQTMVNADGKNIYPYQKANYHMQRIFELQEIDFDAVDPDTGEPLYPSELHNEAPNRDFIIGNYLLSQPEFVQMLKSLRTERIDGLRQTSLEEKDGDLKVKMDGRDRDGATYGGMTTRELMLQMYSLFADASTDTDVAYTATDQTRQVEKVNARRSVFNIMEASNTLDVLNMPVHTLYKDGKLTDRFKNAMFAEVKREADRITRVRAGEYTDDYVNFNSFAEESKLRGLKFWENKALLEEAGVREALESGSITFEEAAPAILAAMDKHYAKEVQEHIDYLVQQRILGRDDKKKLFNRLLPGKFEGVGIEGDAMFNASLQDNIANSFFNMYLNSIAINQILMGDPALTLKDSTDWFKRAKGNNAAGDNLTHFNPAYNGPVRTLVFGRETDKGTFDDFVNTDYVKEERIYKKGSKEYNDFAASLPAEEREAFFAKDAEEIKIGDAQAYTTVDGLARFMINLGRMTTKGLEIYRKIAAGASIDAKDWKYLKDNGLMLNSQKLVYYDGTSYVKMSIVPLTPEYTTKPDGTAIKGMEFLHNLRVQMQENNIDMAGQPSMMKKMIKNPLVLGEGQTEFTIDPRNVMGLDARYLRLQQENPSNKIEIKDPTQMLHIIAAEHEPATPVDFPWDPSVKTIGDLVKWYDRVLAERVETQFKPARAFITQLQEGKRSVNTKRIVKAFRKILESTGASQQLLDYLRVDDAGYPIENFNLPNVVTAFEQHFNTYFNKVFSQKVPGYKTTLQSGFGHNILYDKNTGKIITRTVYLQDPAKYDNDPDIGTRRLGFDIPHYVDGKEVYKYSEVVLPFHFAQQFNLKPGDEIPEEIAYLFGTKIPSQDKHSARVLKIVDILPASYGSNMIMPDELILLTGSDFDVDSFYNQRPDHYVKKTKGFSPLVGSSEYKIVFGHPGIGKTFLKESGRTDVIDFDSDYKNRINEMFNLPKGFKARNDFQKANKEKYNQVVRELWAEAKQEALQTGKQLFASDMILLREFADDFDIVLTMSQKTFIERAKQRNDYTPGPEGTEKWKSNLDFLIDKIDRSKVFVTDKYLSDLMISSEKAVKFMVYGNNEDSKWEQFQRWHAVNNKFLSEIVNELRSENPGIEADAAYEAAFKMLDLPSTEEEFVKMKMRNPGEINNDLLNARMVLHSNPSMEDINKTPATLDAIQNKEGTGVLDRRARKLGYVSWKELETSLSPNSPMGMVRAFETNKAGSKAIGAAVNNTQVYAVLTRFGLMKRKDSSVRPVFVAGTEVGDISSTRFVTKTGKRIMDVLSTLTSSMTDNAKYGYNSKMNMDINTLSVVSLLEMNGVPLETAVDLINAESVKEYIQRSQGYAIQTEEESSYQGDADQIILNEIEKKIIELDPTLYDKIKSLGEEPVTQDDLNISYEYSPDRKQYVESNATGKTALDNQVPVEYYMAQYRILSNYAVLARKHVPEYIAFSQLMKLTKGVSSSTKETSFKGDEEIKAYLDKLNLKLVRTRTGWTVDYKDSSEEAMTRMVYDFKDVVNNHKITLQNLAVFAEKSEIQKEYFVSQTQFANDVKTSIFSNLNSKLGAKKRKKAAQDINLNLNAYLMLKAWRNSGAFTGNMNAYLFDEASKAEGIKTMVELYDEILKKNPALKDNLVFTQIFIDSQNGISTAKYNTFSKGQKGFETLLLGEMRRLANSEARPLVHHMIKYMIAKEAMLFKNDSPISLINPSTLGTYNFSSMITEFTPVLNGTNDAQFQKTFGMSRTELMKEFTELFMRDVNNSRNGYVPSASKDLLVNKDTEKSQTVNPVSATKDSFTFNFDAGFKMLDENGDEVKPDDEVKNKQIRRNNLFASKFGFATTTAAYPNKKKEIKQAKAFEFPAFIRIERTLYRLESYVPVTNRFDNTENRNEKMPDKNGKYIGVAVKYVKVERFGGNFNGVNITPYGRTLAENEEFTFESMLEKAKASKAMPQPEIEATNNEVVDETTVTPLPQIGTVSTPVVQDAGKSVTSQEESGAEKQQQQAAKAASNLAMLSTDTQGADIASKDNVITWLQGVKNAGTLGIIMNIGKLANAGVSLSTAIKNIMQKPTSPTEKVDQIIELVRKASPQEAAELDKHRC